MPDNPFASNSGIDKLRVASWWFELQEDHRLTVKIADIWGLSNKGGYHLDIILRRAINVNSPVLSLELGENSTRGGRLRMILCFVPHVNSLKCSQPNQCGMVTCKLTVVSGHVCVRICAIEVIQYSRGLSLDDWA
jgi:hypothetical protein